VAQEKFTNLLIGGYFEDNNASYWSSVMEKV
jgi:hypothetical protein